MRTVRYARSWKHGSAVAHLEIEIKREGVRLPATLVAPVHARGALPGWILLGGVTRMGRFHPQLSRFADALTASGAVVIVPEVPEWRDLRLAPGVTLPTVRGAVRALDARPEVRHGRYGLAGVSFGAPQAAIATTDRELADRIAGVVLFGGYCDLERTLHCQLTGVHEWRGVSHRLDPDPYGRWVLASNYLTEVPGYEDANDVAESLRRLALASTERRVPAWDPRLDSLRDELRDRVARGRRGLYDLFANVAPAPACEAERCEAMARDLARACRRAEPLLDPAPALGRIRVPVRLFHGRGDRLVPFTESLRFHEGLAKGVPADVTVTGLFAHSADHRLPSLAARVRESVIFFRAFQRALAAV